MLSAKKILVDACPHCGDCRDISDSGDGTSRCHMCGKDFKNDPTDFELFCEKYGFHTHGDEKYEEIIKSTLQYNIFIFAKRVRELGDSILEGLPPWVLNTIRH